MFRKIMIALLVLLQIAFPVGMATYRPADEDVIREKGTRYVLETQGGLSCRTSGSVNVFSSWLPLPDLYETQGRYALLETDPNGYARVEAFSQQKPVGDAYLLHTEANRIGEYFSIDVPPALIDALRREFRQTYTYDYDESFTEYELERKDGSPTLAAELYVYRGHAALGGLLVDGMTAEEYLSDLQGGNS
ncbi:MAG: hypothetical protein IJL26_10715 [Clostridia bacterium]|nr:hypothetical protein [Clostridia bacterium]